MNSRWIATRFQGSELRSYQCHFAAHSHALATLPLIEPSTSVEEGPDWLAHARTANLALRFVGEGGPDWLAHARTADLALRFVAGEAPLELGFLAFPPRACPREGA